MVSGKEMGSQKPSGQLAKELSAEMAKSQSVDFVRRGRPSRAVGGKEVSGFAPIRVADQRLLPLGPTSLCGTHLKGSVR